MDRMLVVVFDSESKADEGKKALRELEIEGTVVIYTSAVVARNNDGTTTVKRIADLGPLGTLLGTSYGSFIGLIGGPVGMAVGAVAGLVAGIAVDLNDARIGEDFIDDVTRELKPNRFALVAEIQEEWTTSTDARMEALGGTVLRRALSEVKHIANDEAAAAIKADIAQLRAEHAKARADRKAKLQERINELDSRLQARLERAKERRRAAERLAEAKAALLADKAAALKTKAANIHM